MIKGLIFDLDGTTLNTLEDLSDAVNRTMLHFGFPQRSIDEVRQKVGKGSKKLMEDTVPEDTDPNRIPEILEYYISAYGENYADKTVPYEGIRDLLHSLQLKGIRLAINSNKPDHLTKGLIERNFPEIDFVAVYGSMQDMPHKPDPAGANAILEHMHLSKEEVLYVGDSETDMLTASNAGLKSIACLWGFRSKEVLEEAGADYIAEKPEDIWSMIQ